MHVNIIDETGEKHRFGFYPQHFFDTMREFHKEEYFVFRDLTGKNKKLKRMEQDLPQMSDKRSFFFKSNKETQEQKIRSLREKLKVRAASKCKTNEKRLLVMSLWNSLRIELEKPENTKRCLKADAGSVARSVLEDLLNSQIAIRQGEEASVLKILLDEFFKKAPTE